MNKSEMENGLPRQCAHWLAMTGEEKEKRMRIEMPKGSMYTPLLIGVCNNKSAVLCADSGAAFYDSDGFRTDDRCRKLFQMSERLLFGARGLFWGRDRFIEPFAGKDCAELNVDTASELVVEYLLGEKAVGRKLLDRCYVLAGLDGDGEMCMSLIGYDADEDEITQDKRIGDEHGAYILLLPPNGENEREVWQRHFEDVLADESAPLPERLRGYIAELAENSETVGGKVLYKSVKKDS